MNLIIDLAGMDVFHLCLRDGPDWTVGSFPAKIAHVGPRKALGESSNFEDLIFGELAALLVHEVDYDLSPRPGVRQGHVQPLHQPPSSRLI